MLVFLARHHRSKLAALRRQVDKTGLEEAAQMSSLVHALADELVAAHPIPMSKIESDFIHVFQGGDMNLELLLQGAVHEKSTKQARQNQR